MPQQRRSLFYPRFSASLRRFSALQVYPITLLAPPPALTPLSLLTRMSVTNYTEHEKYIKTHSLPCACPADISH